MASLKLNKFDLSRIDDHSIIVAIAKRKSGKTVLIKEICYTKRKFACGLILCPTERMNQDYKMFFPDLFIHYEVNVTLLKKILERQISMVEKNHAKQQSGQTVDPRMLLVMDDCMGQKDKWKKDPAVNVIFVEGRHYQITYVLALQDPMDLPPGFRGNIDYVFLLQCKAKSEQIKLHKHYAGVIDPKIFASVFSKCTANYGIMVVDVNAKSSLVEANIFHYRVTPEEMDRSFAFGSKTFRKYHEHYYDPDYRTKARNNDLKEILGINAPDVIFRM